MGQKLFTKIIQEKKILDISTKRWGKEELFLLQFVCVGLVYGCYFRWRFLAANSERRDQSGRGEVANFRATQKSGAYCEYGRIKAHVCCFQIHSVISQTCLFRSRRGIIINDFKLARQDCKKCFATIL